MVGAAFDGGVRSGRGVVMAYCALHNRTFPDAAMTCPWCSEEWDEEDFAECTCDIDDEDSCPIHYPIDDGSDDDDCMDCGMCDSCIERTRAFYEEMEA